MIPKLYASNKMWYAPTHVTIRIIQVGDGKTPWSLMQFCRAFYCTDGNPIYNSADNKQIDLKKIWYDPSVVLPRCTFEIKH
jgi:hypothetical protein